MNKPWYDRDPDSYSALREEVESVYTELHFTKCAADIRVTGFYPLHEGDKVWDRYQVKLLLAKESPRGIPALYEIGNRIPRKSDRHMEPDGRACIVLPDAYWYEYPQGMSLLDFLNGPALNFFVNQSLIDLGQSNVWQTGEWGHGAEGIVEFYESILGTNNRAIILTFLGILKRDTIKGHWPCPCGSKKRLRNCHGKLINGLRMRIPQLITKESEKKLAETLTKSSSPLISRSGGFGHGQ
jgi:hypothetical protein